MSLERNLKVFYITHPLANLHFLAPVFPLIFLAKGFGYSVYSLAVLTIFFLTSLLLEIPSGYFADKVGYKVSFLLSNFLIMLAFSVFALGTEAWQLYFGAFIGGVGLSLITGPYESLVYETCKSLKTDFKTYWSKIYAATLVCFAITSLLGGWLFSLDPTYPLWGVVLVQFISLLGLFFITEPAREKSLVPETKELKLIFSKKKIWWLTAYFVFIVSFLYLLHNSFLQEFVANEVGYVLLGLMFALYRIVQAASSYFTRNHHMSRKLLYILPLIVALILFLHVVLPVNYIFFFGIYVALGVLFPMLTAEIQESVSSNLRSTATSVVSASRGLVLALAGLIFGYVADWYGVSFVLFSIAGLFIVSTVVLFFTRKYLLQ